MNRLQLLESVHILLAMASGLGFALRGFVRRVLERPLEHPLMRIGPHVLDTLLLASGVGLWIGYRYSPLDSAWLGAKLVLILLYIVLGLAAFRIQRRERAVLAYVAGLAVFATIAALAITKPL